MIFRGAGLGDVITSTACARSLLEDHGIETHAAVKTARWGYLDWCLHDPYIQAVGEKPPGGPYLAAIKMFRPVMSRKDGEEASDLATWGEVRRSRIEMAAAVWSKAIGKPVRATLPTYHVREHEAKAAQAWFDARGLGPDRCIMFQPDSSAMWRRWPWPLAGRFVRLCEASGWTVCTYSIWDTTGIGGVACLPKTLPEAMAILDRCRFFVGVDGAAMHMAGALRKPMFGLFGGTHGAAIGKIYERSTWTQGVAGAHCNAPCHLSRARGYRASLRCREIGCEAMWDIKPEAVWERVRARLNASN